MPCWRTRHATKSSWQPRYTVACTRGRTVLGCLYTQTLEADRKVVDAVAVLALRLSPDDLAQLEAPYVPHAVVGFS